MNATASVRDNTDAARFEAWIDGELAGFADYLRAGNLAVYPHTEVREAFEGRGIGSTLARTALDDARSRDLRVLAPCPFISGWLERHPEYHDLAYENRSRVSD
ncbi:GNAT family N-acetyltransferase [Streptomyces litchfieldiae]|uniref:GNAT family N-acetyltransferase n=1 Tax=Streptomyces litchfieldiae TaxID=3075543 RepID=A0ABU2MV74_9ACTN|nr:GNAT family N-acetyltransferase [Streptomyces sp. DSM 44938]MDT0345376.1 GNAT family N-acetyltransferase [Streptomyces sp. DSM 44938]